MSSALDRRSRARPAGGGRPGSVWAAVKGPLASLLLVALLLGAIGAVGAATEAGQQADAGPTVTGNANTHAEPAGPSSGAAGPSASNGTERTTAIGDERPRANQSR